MTICDNHADSSSNIFGELIHIILRNRHLQGHSYLNSWFFKQLKRFYQDGQLFNELDPILKKLFKMGSTPKAIFHKEVTINGGCHNLFVCLFVFSLSLSLCLSLSALSSTLEFLQFPVCRKTAGQWVSQHGFALYCSVATSPGALPLPQPSPGSQQLAVLPRSWHHPDPEGRIVAEVASHVTVIQSVYVLCSPVMQESANNPQIYSAFLGLREVNSCLENKAKKALIGKRFRLPFLPFFC